MHGKSHTARDAALGGAAVGTGAYEAGKLHHGHESSTNKPLPTAPGNHGIGTGAGTQNALAGEIRHGGAVPLAEKPAGKDLGDKLHGVERNRGVSGESGFPGTEGYGAGTHHNTTGQGLTGSTQHSNVPGTSGHSSNLTGTGTGNQTSHTGRDAAALGTAGAVGEHEYRKHENPTSHSGLGGSNQHSSTAHHSNLTGTGNNQQYGTTGNQQYGTTGTSQQYGTTGTQQYGTTRPSTLGQQSHTLSEATTDQSGNPIGLSSSSGDRNRLHKDPPASHPASQLHSSSQAQDTKGGVPASGAERERMIGQGEERLDKDTGVAHGGVDTSRNY